MTIAVNRNLSGGGGGGARGASLPRGTVMLLETLYLGNLDDLYTGAFTED